MDSKGSNERKYKISAGIEEYEVSEELYKAIKETEKVCTSTGYSYCISREEAMFIIRREHPEYSEQDRYVKKDDIGLKCSLFLLRKSDGRYRYITYYLDKPDDPFNGEYPKLLPL